MHPVVHEALAELRQRQVVERIWQRDHTVWKLDPHEIVDRLGWLGVATAMLPQASGLELFAADLRRSGLRDCVLLGMGGSSLGAEVLRRTFASGRGLRLHVLDSTVPAQIRAVADSVDPARTLFLVSSKSGTTVEPLCLMAYFRGVVEEAVGRDRARDAFAVITDPGTPLAGMACRRTFLNPPDIGGRYSVLSYFGLVPAAIAGVDVKRLLEPAESMRAACSPSMPIEHNPAARLGAMLGAFARQGRNKLAIITSPALDSFGLWAEQLIAESTGKEGKGIVPVAGEPLMQPRDYGDDRLFVYLRLAGDNNAAADAAVAALQEADLPVSVLEMADKYDLGAELFRWEFAVAIAGAIMGVQPFDQPDVQSTKSATDGMLGSYAASGRLPSLPPGANVSELLAGAAPGSYLAIMAYLPQTEDADRALAQVRARVARQYHIATTVSYGPRYLHSTGQLHKGGPAGGLFLQIGISPGKDEPDLAIPGRAFSFAVLAGAQALGDLKALQGSGRKVAAVRISGPLPEALGRLADELCRPAGQPQR